MPLPSPSPSSANVESFYALSTVGSISANMWDTVPTQSTSSIAGNLAMPSHLTEYDADRPLYSSILVAYMDGVRNPSASVTSEMNPGTVDNLLGTYVQCNANKFKDGIEYSLTFFKTVFPAAWVVISDACVKFKNTLHTELASSNQLAVMNSMATIILADLVTLTALVGQRIERGKYPISFSSVIDFLQQDFNVAWQSVQLVYLLLGQALLSWYVTLILKLVIMCTIIYRWQTRRNCTSNPWRFWQLAWSRSQRGMHSVATPSKASSYRLSRVCLH